MRFLLTLFTVIEIASVPIENTFLTITKYKTTVEQSKYTVYGEFVIEANFHILRINGKTIYSDYIQLRN